MRWMWALFVPFVLGHGEPLRVMLDFYPNPNHVPLYVAQAQGLFRAAGVEVEIIAPSDPSDPTKLVAARAVDLALTPQANYLLARGAGLPLVAVGALIDGALGGLLALERSGITDLADLRGRRIGYALEPLEPVLWRTMLRHAGVEPAEVELVYVGMNTLFALLARRVDAIGAFRNYEVLAVEALGDQPRFFPQEEHGVPDTYELVLIAHPTFVRAHLPRVRLFVQALAEAIDFTLDHPAEALAMFEAAVPELAGEELTRRSFAATLPRYARGVRHDDVPRWEAMQAYLVAHGLIPHALPITDLITTEALP
ncbi:MAG: Hydroxymethylpyrimidine ABC transporter, substrate-binding component [Candidatus Bipolaricaulis sibiricus]|uniref:Hydroxymethylpyrimidine ABC transporter, substrate-binding component n=1 Tax=Bipolaricaulis sibiricus TaxID=2501609 RepID=A0A410FTE7_BIPS1|nr:MAG: Hydroxymethylpyrimidine ABC transporter, substrate-binding component [Candidatus Bipolaricaulis sibiricus]